MAELAAKWLPYECKLRDDGSSVPVKTWRLASEPLARALRSIKFSALDKGILATVGSDGIWTRARLVSTGLVMSPLCELCGQERDTVWHRILQCQERQAVALRARLCPSRVVSVAITKGAAHPLYIKGWMEHPTHEWPSPSISDDNAQWPVWKERTALGWGPAVHCELSGDVYQDGSCTPHVFRELSRASWGIVELPSEGQVTKSCLLYTSDAADE